MISSQYLSLKWLLTMVILPSVSIADLDWQKDKDGHFKWAYNCEFNGSDINAISPINNEFECGSQCYDNPVCTHFTWNYDNTCHLKHFKNLPDATNFNRFECGWISSRGSEPQVVYTPKRISGWNGGIDDGVKWAKPCQFYGPDDSKLESISHRQADSCRSDCAAMQNCTNFNWIDGKCNLEHFDYPVPAYNYDGLICGFATRSGIIAKGPNELNPSIWEIPNRDGDSPKFPLEPDMRYKSSNIAKADEILRDGLQEFLEFKNADLGTYLSYLINKRTQPFIDEYGQVIRNYKKVFRFIWEQYNETLVQNYAIGQFNKDKLDLCSVARFLSHQPTVEQRENIMKRMGDALGFRCNPCTPYTPKQWGETIIPNIGSISQEGVSPQEALIICKENSGQTDKTVLTSTVSSVVPSLVSSVVGETFTYISVTNGGVWGKWRNKQYGHTWKAIGFSLKVQPEQGDGPLMDDTALNGIILYIIQNGDPAQVLLATAQEGRFGDWGPQYKCPGEENYLVSFRLKVQGPQGGGELEDDTAANDVEFKCTKGEVISSTNGGKLGSWGEWSPTCPTGFCGIETKVELLLDAGGDDTALNDVRFMCGC